MPTAGTGQRAPCVGGRWPTGAGRGRDGRARAERGEAGRQAAAEANPQKTSVEMWNVVVTTAGRWAGDGLREKLA